jgi:hypothetical protein
MEADIGKRAGSYCVSVHQTRTNGKIMKHPAVSLQKLLKKCDEFKVDGQYRVPVVTRMTSGISLNGKEFCENHYCEFLIKTPRNRPLLVGSPNTFRVGCITAFYTVRLGDEMLVFVKLRVEEILSVVGGTYVLKENEKSDLDFEYMSVDRITRKVKRVPHWTMPTQCWCGVPIWNTV